MNQKYMHFRSEKKSKTIDTTQFKQFMDDYSKIDKKSQPPQNLSFKKVKSDTFYFKKNDLAEKCQSILYSDVPSDIESIYENENDLITDQINYLQSSNVNPFYKLENINFK